MIPTLTETELSDTIYLLLDDNGDLQNWTSDIGAARMMQVTDGYDICRFTHDPMQSKPWEGVNQDKVRSLEEYQ